MSYGHNHVKFAKYTASQDDHFSAPVWLNTYATIAIFFMTLQSFYFGNSGASWFCYAGAAMIAVLSVNKIRAIEPLMVIVSLTCLSAIQLYSDMDVEFKSVVSVTFSAAMMLFVPMSFGNRKNNLYSAITFAIWLHLGFYATQVAFWLATGRVLDFPGLLGFEPASWSSLKGFVISGTLVPRFTGIMNEPGTYSAIVMTLVVARYALKRSVDRTTAITLATALGSASLGGALLVGGFIACVALNNLVTKRKGFAGGAAIISLLLIIGSAWIRSLMEKRVRFSSSESSYHSIIVKWLTSPDNITIFGLQKREIPLGFVINDIGVWAEILARWGLAGLFLTLSYLAFVVGGTDMLLMGLILITKLKVTYPLLFFALGVIRLDSSKSDRNIQ